MIWKILGLFARTLTADEKYSLVYRDNLMQHIQMQIPNKQTEFSQFFSAFLKSKLKFEHFQKRWPSWLLYLQNYGLRNMWVDKWLESLV